MIRGHLKIFVLKLLEKEPKTGYVLMNDIEELIGKKPSSGSMYPLLDSMDGEGIVKSEDKGRTKVYTLTLKGKKLLKETYNQKDKIINKLSELANLLENVCDSKENSEFFNSILNELKEHRFPFSHLNPELLDFRHNIMFFIDVDHKNIKKVKKLLKETSKELRKLR